MNLYCLVILLSHTISCVNNHLHHTSSASIINRSYYDCLYSHTQLYSENDNEMELVDAWSLIPYCRRSSPSSKIDQYQCQGRQMTFEELRQENITIDDLFSWQVSIDILNDYTRFLQNELTDQIFCKCSTRNSFGKNCEYILNDWPHTPLETQITDYFQYGSATMSETCYHGALANKCRNKKCLNWRQICDGFYDCEMGEDESFCSILEANICQENEYRCRNGLCIPLLFAFDYIYDCLDRTDESYDPNDRIEQITYYLIEIDFPKCSNNPSILCEEYSCYFLEQSCETFQCLPRTGIHPFKSDCYNSASKDLWKKTFAYDHFISKKCWYAFMCLLNIEDIYDEQEIMYPCNDICDWPRPIRRRDRFSDRFKRLRSCKQGIVKYCPKYSFIFPKQHPDIQFPANVTFKYNQSDPNFHRAGLPELICYDGTWCDPDFSQPKYRCHRLNQLRIEITDTLNYWQFYDELKRYFSLNCHPPSLLKSIHSFEIKQTNLYQCKQSNRSISIYRLKDKTRDCFRNDDELLKYEFVCSLNLTDRMICTDGCIPKRDVLAQTSDDLCYPSQLFHIAQCSNSQDQYPFGCQWLRDGSIMQIQQIEYDLFRFWKICDGEGDYRNLTDELNCETWKQTCNRRSIECNGYWDCIDGSDETNCDKSIEKSLLTTSSDHYCFTINGLTRLHIRYVGNKQIDCLGGTDERDGYCFLKHPFEYSRRFRCMNSSICIQIENICDGQDDCPYGDDEWPCPWRKRLRNRSNCSIGMFACQDQSFCTVHGNQRCFYTDKTAYPCKTGEHLWFCDLIDFQRVYSPVTLDGFNHFPIFQKINSILNLQIQLTQSVTRTNVDSLSFKLNCHRGLPVSHQICLCPPSYSGEYCQYQHDRISIHVSFEFPYYRDDLDDSAEFFRLIATLRNERNETIDREELILHYRISNYKHLFYLVYSNSFDEHLFYSIYFDIYRITLNSQIEFLFREIHPIHFGFLPVNRLALIIKLSNQNHQITTENQTINSVCSLGRYGNHCQFQYNPCQQTINPCKNNGTP